MRKSNEELIAELKAVLAGQRYHLRAISNHCRCARRFLDYLEQRECRLWERKGSFRDTWRLFLRFVATGAEKKVAMITLADPTAGEVAAFLAHTEHDRGGTIGTRNCRLAAIRSFFTSSRPRIPHRSLSCSRSSTTAGHGYRRLSSCAPWPAAGFSDTKLS
ncbi:MULTISPECIES: hypothetical protein [unclassified Mesorhizobium]|uniref:hypothetical protein n=1 Tax=unclassified Mesorhizobium TaxID=325217 RepID=UPI001AED51B3|nr:MULTISPECIES: hypothetical protein [unclassified Mesorhizobium]